MAKGFAGNGAKVYITGRRADVLEKTAEELSQAASGKGGQVLLYVLTSMLDWRIRIRSSSELMQSLCSIQGDVATKESCAAVARAFGEKETKVRKSKTYAHPSALRLKLPC
jgi:NAD(P)-dependent dehydrogenase (short-subunit alcohol dehydrogenase family)